jgi:hypothetical protein
MGKVKTRFLGLEDDEKQQKQEQKKKKHSKEAKKKVHLAGMKGGERTVTVEADEKAAAKIREAEKFVKEEPASAEASSFAKVSEDKPAGETAANQADLAWLLDEELVELGGSGERTRSPADVIGQELRLPPGLNALTEVVAGQDTGKVFRFTRGNINVGRRNGEVPLSDGEVSRRHSVIEVFGRDMIFLRDLGSTNGTYHNGRRILVARLRSGDTIGVGKTVLKLHVTR